MSLRKATQSWRERLQAKFYDWKHSLRRRLNPVHKLRVNGKTFFVSKLMPSDLELADMMEGVIL